MARARYSGRVAHPTHRGAALRVILLTIVICAALWFVTVAFGDEIGAVVSGWLSDL